jgi:hypothetical protein
MPMGPGHTNAPREKGGILTVLQCPSEAQAFGIDGKALISGLQHCKIVPSTALDVH